MRGHGRVEGPGLVVRTAKNEPTGPGFHNHPGMDRKGSTPMVGNTVTAGEPPSEQDAAAVALEHAYQRLMVLAERVHTGRIDAFEMGLRLAAANVRAMAREAATGGDRR